jgi:hypothetical protein
VYNCLAPKEVNAIQASPNPKLLSLMSPEETKKFLAKAFWDISINPNELYLFLIGEADQVSHITRERLYRRLLETYSWYRILELVPGDQLESMLNENVISQLRNENLQKRYGVLAEILRTNPVSASG